MRIVPNQDRDFTEWHGGCRHALVWALDVDTPAVRERVSEARSLLAPHLLGRYRRQPHITVAFAGLDPLPGATPTGGLYTGEDRRGHIEGLTRLRHGPLDVEVGGWATYPMAPYLEVSAPGFEPLRDLLTTRPGLYTPHVTIGLYAVESELGTVADLMADFQATPIRLRVEAVSLMSYEASDIAGPLTTLGRFSLTEGSWSATA